MSCEGVCVRPSAADALAYCCIYIMVLCDATGL